jgi:DNA replication protein DnaC
MQSSCPKCQGRKYRVERKGDLAHAITCECAKPCARCGNVGYVYAKQQATFSEREGARSYDVLVDCDCRVRDRRVRQFNDARLPALSATATFENFKPAKTEQARALKATQSFAHGYSAAAPSRGVVLSGPVGTGKTHLITAALTHLLLEKGVRCAYVEISLLYATIRRGFQEGKSGGEIIGPLTEVDVLAIDELGKGRGSQFEMETMDELIARRYNAGKTTLFATNYGLLPEHKNTGSRGAPAGYRNTAAEAKGAGREPELLRERVGERIYSRLCEMCDFIEMPLDTPDHRRARHEVR